jgi:hypothetical protein
MAQASLTSLGPFALVVYSCAFVVILSLSCLVVEVVVRVEIGIVVRVASSSRQKNFIKLIWPTLN